MPPETALLATFVAVVAEGNITRAAVLLHLSQPTVSAQLQRLERLVGSALLDRMPGGVRPTAAGAALVPYAERALATLDAGVAAARAAGGGVTRLRVDVLDPTLDVPRRALSRLHSELPHLELEVTAHDRDRRLHELSSGRLDLALAGDVGDGDLPAGTRRLPLTSEPLGVAVSVDHRLAGRTEGVALPDLADDAQYVPRAEFAPDWVALVQRLCADAGFTPRFVGVRAECTAAPLAMVADGTCVAISLLSTPVPDGVAMLPLSGVDAFDWVLLVAEPRGPDTARTVAAAVSALRHL